MSRLPTEVISLYVIAATVPTEQTLLQNTVSSLCSNKGTGYCMTCLKKTQNISKLFDFISCLVWDKKTPCTLLYHFQIAGVKSLLCSDAKPRAVSAALPLWLAVENQCTRLNQSWLLDILLEWSKMSNNHLWPGTEFPKLLVGNWPHTCFCELWRDANYGFDRICLHKGHIL